MTDIANRGPLGLKGQKEAPRKFMRRVAKGKKSSSDCPIMRSAKGEACLADWCGCNGSTETTAMRHIRKFKIGGMASKPPNYIGFYGCQVAEDIFALKGEQGWTWEGLLRAMVLTQMKLRAKELMPQ
jgi:hypothetical protein